MPLRPSSPPPAGASNCARISAVACGEVQAYPHHGFWQAMDTLRDKQQMEELWASGKAPWKSW